MIGLQQGLVDGFKQGPFGALVCLASEQNKLRSGHAPEGGTHVRETGSSVEKRHETRLVDGGILPKGW